MYLTVLGINHRTAPVEIRGQVAFPPEQIERALGELRTLDGVHEAAILSTCNRTELYCAREDASPARTGRLAVPVPPARDQQPAAAYL